MAQRDYVKHGRASPVRKELHNKTREENSVSTFTLVLAVVILTAFAGGLYYIKHNNKPDYGAQTLLQIKPSVKDTLPPPPKKTYVYIDELENRPVILAPNSVETNNNSTLSLSPEQQQVLAQMQADRSQPNKNLPATYNQQVTPRTNNGTQAPTNIREVFTPPARSSTPSTWLMQCGSFRTQEQAGTVKAQLALSGISSRITLSGGWYRVILGPYLSRAETTAMRPRLQTANITGCIVLSPQ